MLGGILVIWLFTSMFLAGWMVVNVDGENLNAKTGSITVIKEFIEKSFRGRNCFGIVLSMITFIVTIPAILMILMTQVVLWFGCIVSYIWKLGNKKE